MTEQEMLDYLATRSGVPTEEDPRSPRERLLDQARLLVDEEETYRRWSLRGLMSARLAHRPPLAVSEAALFWAASGHADTYGRAYWRGWLTESRRALVDTVLIHAAEDGDQLLLLHELFMRALLAVPARRNGLAVRRWLRDPMLRRLVPASLALVVG